MSHLLGSALAPLCVASRDSLEQRQHVAGLVRFACARLLAWWLSVSLSVFRSARAAVVTVPLILLGTIELRACARSSTETVRPRRRVVLVVTLMWLATAWGALLADRTGWREGFWLVLLASTLAPCAWFVRRLADCVLLPRGMDAFPQDSMVTDAAWPEQLPEQARVSVEQWQGSAARLCDGSPIPLPRSWESAKAPHRCV